MSDAEETRTNTVWLSTPLKDGLWSISIPDPSEWTCYLFGGSPGRYGLKWKPEKGSEPNAWWRFWQRVMFGNRWVRDRSKQP